MLGPSEYLACVAPDCEDVTHDKNIGAIDPFSMIVRNEYVFVQVIHNKKNLVMLKICRI